MSVPRSHHNRPHRHLAAVGDDMPPFDDDAAASWFDPFREPVESRPGLFDHLVGFVGDLAVLLDLDAEPLPDEPFDWSSAAADDHPIVAAVLARSDECCDALLDVEYRTIARRILARVAARDPRPLRRTTNVDRLAAGLVWLAGYASAEFGRRSRRSRSAQWLWDWFGVSSCSDRGHRLRKAAELFPEVASPDAWRVDQVQLGDAGLLHSRFRAYLIVQRDAVFRIERERRKWSLLPDGRSAECRVAVAQPVAVGPGRRAETGEAIVLMALGDRRRGLDDADLYGLTVPEARRLVEMLRRALR